MRIIPKDNDDNTCRLNIGYFSDRKNIHFKSQVFSFPNTPLPSNADIFDLCAPSLNHLPLCRLLCRSLKASPHSNLVYSGSETEHKVAKRVDKSWWFNDWFNYISFYLTTLYDDITMITSMTRTRAASVTILILMSCLLCWVPVSVSHLLICQKVSLFMMNLMMISYLIMIMMVTQNIPTMTKSHHGGEMSVKCNRPVPRVTLYLSVSPRSRWDRYPGC